MLDMLKRQVYINYLLPKETGNDSENSAGLFYRFSEGLFW